MVAVVNSNSCDVDEGCPEAAAAAKNEAEAIRKTCRRRRKGYDNVAKEKKQEDRALVALVEIADAAALVDVVVVVVARGRRASCRKS